MLIREREHSCDNYKVTLKLIMEVSYLKKKKKYLPHYERELAKRATLTYYDRYFIRLYNI